MPVSPPPFRVPSSGSVFILALWTLFFLGALALAVGALVSANLNAASALRNRMIARELARAGVQLAVDEVVTHGTNWNSKVWDRVDKREADPPNNEDLFKANDSLDGGEFSVTYAYIPTAGDQVVTNYGVLSESRKININGLNQTTLASELAARAGLSERMAEDVAEVIYKCRRKNAKGGLTEKAGSTYADGSVDEYGCHEERFRVLLELLLLNRFRNDPALFRQLQPYLTVHGRGSASGKEGFSGTSTGRALASRAGQWGADRTVLAESRIDFVVNENGDMEYWHEH